jgi:hypothetical protein
MILRKKINFHEMKCCFGMKFQTTTKIKNYFKKTLENDVLHTIPN